MTRLSESCAGCGLIGAADAVPGTDGFAFVEAEFAPEDVEVFLGDLKGEVSVGASKGPFSADDVGIVFCFVGDLRESSRAGFVLQLVGARVAVEADDRADAEAVCRHVVGFPLAAFEAWVLECGWREFEALGGGAVVFRLRLWQELRDAWEGGGVWKVVFFECLTEFLLFGSEQRELFGLEIESAEDALGGFIEVVHEVWFAVVDDGGNLRVIRRIGRVFDEPGCGSQFAFVAGRPGVLALVVGVELARGAWLCECGSCEGEYGEEDESA